jgi:hypothetical protein
MPADLAQHDQHKSNNEKHNKGAADHVMLARVIVQEISIGVPVPHGAPSSVPYCLESAFLAIAAAMARRSGLLPV